LTKGKIIPLEEVGKFDKIIYGYKAQLTLLYYRFRNWSCHSIRYRERR
jgi:hypothetical protein